jgi:hypothetical protein
VIRHEAMAIRRARTESVTGEEVDLDAFVPGPDRSVEDQIASGERVRRSAEALRALKPDEAQALMMKAHGLSYQEIGERNGWSYTKVNRAITEGRRRFMRVYEGIESGAECERFSPIVEALARGEATSKQVLAIRPHLRHCSACRAAVRDLHLSRLRRASLLWPIGALAIPLAHASSSGRRAGPDVPSLEEVLEIEPASTPGHGMFGTLKHELAAMLHRLNASDAATGLHIATSSGGGRVSSLAAIVALCLGGLTAGTVCVVTGVIPDPLDRIGPKPPAHVQPETRAKDARDSPERERRPPVLLSDKPAPAPVYSATHDPKPRDDDVRPDSRRAQRQVVDEGSRRSPSEQSDPAQTEFGVEQAMSASSASTESQGSASQPDAAAQAELDPAEKEFVP